MRAGAVAVVLWLLLVFTGCRSDVVGTDLLEVVDFAPKELDVGDRLELVGAGFPEGKPATLTFRGDLYRPGREPIRGVEIVAPASSTSQSRIALVLNEALYREFVGHGPHASHTTFHGELSGAFAPRSATAPPIRGRLADVVIDFAPPPAALDQEGGLAEGKRLLDFAGIALDPERGQRLVVKSVAPGGRAERAGILAGDELVEFDGVRVQSAADLIPSGRHREASLLVRRARFDDTVARTLETDGFRAWAPGELAFAAMLVGLLAAIFLLFTLPITRVITWAERRVSARLRAVRRARRSHEPAALLDEVLTSVRTSMPTPAVDKPLVRFVLYLTFLASALVLSWLALGRRLALAELELLLLWVGAATAVSVMALLLGGYGEERRWSLARGLKNAGLATTCQVPACAAVVSVVLSSGSLRLTDIVADQGGAPWHWHAFKNPNLLVMFLLFLASALPEASRAALEIPELESEQPRARELRYPTARALTFFAEWASLSVASGLAAILFLGGWQLPFVTTVQQQTSLLLQALGAALLIAKSWALVIFVLVVRWTLPELRMEQIVRFWWRWLIPVAVAGLAASCLWAYGSASPALRDLQGGFGSVLFALTMFVCGYCVKRIAFGLRHANAYVSVNPWL